MRYWLYPDGVCESCRAVRRAGDRLKARGFYRNIYKYFVMLIGVYLFYKQSEIK